MGRKNENDRWNERMRVYGNDGRSLRLSGQEKTVFNSNGALTQLRYTVAIYIL